MPPVTPSPHRFLPGKRRQPSPPKNVKPTTAPEVPQQRRPPVQYDATPQRPNSSRQQKFAQTPRFSFGRPPSQQPASRLEPNLAQALRRSIRPVEDVEEPQTSNEEDDEMLDVEQEDALPTTESTQEWTEPLPYSPKRRKLNETFESPARPVFKQPTTPASHYASAVPNFIRGGSVANSIANNDTTASLRRPAFMRPSLPPQEHFEPLPEAFSPHRRGEKFVPGGMAATLQQWVIETGQAAAQSRRGQGYLAGEDYVFRLELEEVSISGLVLARGRSRDGERVRLLLIANAKRNAGDVLPGSVIGVRAPTWEVELEGEVWNVAVDWRITS